MTPNLIDLTGMTFGSLTVLRQDPLVRAKYRRYWECECVCGTVKSVQGHHLRNGATTSCGGTAHRSGANSRLWKGYGTIPGKYLSRIMKRAHTKGYQYDLSFSDLEELYQQQGMKCALTNLPIDFVPPNYSASLDRIDSTGGYVVGNVQWVHKDVNLMKNVLSQERFLELCHLIDQRGSATG